MGEFVSLHCGNKVYSRMGCVWGEKPELCYNGKDYTITVQKSKCTFLLDDGRRMLEITYEMIILIHTALGMERAFRQLRTKMWLSSSGVKVAFVISFFLILSEHTQLCFLLLKTSF